MAICPSSTHAMASHQETFRRTRVSKKRSSSESSAIRTLYFSNDINSFATATVSHGLSEEVGKASHHVKASDGGRRLELYCEEFVGPSTGGRDTFKRYS